MSERNCSPSIFPPRTIWRRRCCILNLDGPHPWGCRPHPRWGGGGCTRYLSRAGRGWPGLPGVRLKLLKHPSQKLPTDVVERLERKRVQPASNGSMSLLSNEFLRHAMETQLPTVVASVKRPGHRVGARCRVRQWMETKSDLSRNEVQEFKQLRQAAQAVNPGTTDSPKIVRRGGRSARARAPDRQRPSRNWWMRATRNSTRVCRRRSC